jgi:hypothetical protein
MSAHLSNIYAIMLSQCFWLNYRLPIVTYVFPSGLVCFRLTEYVMFIFCFCHSHFHFYLTKKCESDNGICVFSNRSHLFSPLVIAYCFLAHEKSDSNAMVEAGTTNTSHATCKNWIFG